MERKTTRDIGNHDHRERLITFSALDLHSFSDDDDDIDEEETSYIEIALDKPLVQSLPPQLCNQQREGEGEETEKSKENRVTGFPPSTFYPLLPTFPGLPSSSSSSPTLYSSTNTSNTTSSSCPSECSAGTAADGYIIKSRRSSPEGRYKFSPIPRISNTHSDERNKQLPAFQGLLNALLSAFKHSSLEITKESSRPDDYVDGGNMKTALDVTGSWEVVRSRKTSKPLTTEVNNGGIVKLLIKFKIITIRSVATLLLKSQSGVISPGGNNTSQQNKGGPNKLGRIKNHEKKLTKSFDRYTSVKPMNLQGDQSKINGRSNMDNYSLDAVRGMFDSLNVMKIRRRKGKQTSKSCPNSIKSSPLHGGQALVPSEVRNIYARDNSVQAAIAHCKSSFGGM